MKHRSVLSCLCCLMAILTLVLFTDTSNACANQLTTQAAIESGPLTNSVLVNVADEAPTLIVVTDAPQVASRTAGSVCTCPVGACTCGQTSRHNMLICATHRVRHTTHVHHGVKAAKYGHSTHRSRCRGGICT